MNILSPDIDAADFAKQIELLQIAHDHGFHFIRMPRYDIWKACKALVDAGLLDCWETGSDEAQYTALNFRITDKGREALESVKLSPPDEKELKKSSHV